MYAANMGFKHGIALMEDIIFDDPNVKKHLKGRIKVK
jgi:hypothetical protein